MIFSQSRVLLLLLIPMLLVGGCVTEVIEKKPLESTTLIVTRAGQEVTLNWQSEANSIYTLLYADSRSMNAQWKPVPGAERVRGTGGTMEFKQQVPGHIRRHYRVQTVPSELLRP